MKINEIKEKKYEERFSYEYLLIFGILISVIVIISAWGRVKSRKNGSGGKIQTPTSVVYCLWVK